MGSTHSTKFKFRKMGTNKNVDLKNVHLLLPFILQKWNKSALSLFTKWAAQFRHLTAFKLLLVSNFIWSSHPVSILFSFNRDCLELKNSHYHILWHEIAWKELNAWQKLMNGNSSIAQTNKQTPKKKLRKRIAPRELGDKQASKQARAAS